MDTYDLSEDHGTYALTPSGRFTYNHHAKVLELVAFFSKNKIKKIVVNISNLNFIDSSAVGMLLIIANEVGSNGGVLLLENAHGQVDRVLTAAKVYDVLLMPQYTK